MPEGLQGVGSAREGAPECARVLHCVDRRVGPFLTPHPRYKHAHGAGRWHQEGQGQGEPAGGPGPGGGAGGLGGRVSARRPGAGRQVSHPKRPGGKSRFNTNSPTPQSWRLLRTSTGLGQTRAAARPGAPPAPPAAPLRLRGARGTERRRGSGGRGARTRMRPPVAVEPPVAVGPLRQSRCSGRAPVRVPPGRLGSAHRWVGASAAAPGSGL